MTSHIPHSSYPDQQFSVEDPENPKYRCCCQCCHVTTGSIAIAVVEFVFILFYALRGIVFLARKEHEYTGSSVVSIIGAIIGLIIVGALLFGVLKEMKYFLIPFLAAQVVVILLQSAMVVVCIIYIGYGKTTLLPLIAASDHDPRKNETYEMRHAFDILVYIVLGIYLIGAALGTWFFYVVLYCYVYFKEKELAKRQGFAMLQTLSSTSAADF